MNLNSILRSEEEKAFSLLSFSGKVLDLGGIKNSNYLKLVKGDFLVTTMNLGENVECDIIHNLENTPLPCSDLEYDVVVLNNTLEHIFHARELVKEAVRVVRKGGMIVITVPFLFPIHPSPRDYWRFSEDALVQMLKDAGVNNIKISPLGVGVFIVRQQLLERLLPIPLRFVSYWIRPFAKFFDSVIYKSRKKNSTQKKEFYPSGYFLIGIK